MAIAFNEVPGANLRVPGVYIEFDGRLAGRAVFDAKAVIVGQRLTAGTVAAGVLTPISGNVAAVEQQFGRGSMIAEMIKAAKKAAPWLEMWAVALDDNAAGVKCIKKISITGPATEAGTLNVYIGGYRVQIAIASGDTATAIATALIAAINARTDQPMVASVNGVNAYEVDLTCRWKGETGSAIDVRVNFYDGDKKPAGLAFTITQTTAGSGNPVITPALDALGEEWFNWLSVPYTDAANMTLLETELGSRFGPMRAIGGRAFTAYAGSHAASSSFGNGRNNPHVTCQGAGLSPTAPWIWSSVYMAVAGMGLSIDPSRQLRGKVLPGVLPPAKADRWDDTQRNTLLFDGIATTTVSSAGEVLLESEISMYQLNSGGVGDDAWLYINTPETLERIRLEQRHFFTQRYPNWKLAGDNYDVPPGQPIMQPKKAIMEMLGLYKGFMDKGWVQDYESYKDTILAEVNADNKDRLDIYDSPVLIRNMRIVAMHTESR
ncbi:phage tail sheath subtilisin-like domain-containing protein [Methylomonas sp. 11b]|uniref:phage tail sheath subtilisin-like domain-containing protein n=1 Tax=Methylomonas sp. 11b TaxID=1168169 RepID=UPI000479C3F0|nr:phage tail sheath subtilisin-like domain-containing protein [Methylomonas sp. 11b]